VADRGLCAGDLYLALLRQFLTGLEGEIVALRSRLRALEAKNRSK
jgi:hypothetical protein